MHLGPGFAGFLCIDRRLELPTGTWIVSALAFNRSLLDGIESSIPTGWLRKAMKCTEHMIWRSNGEVQLSDSNECPSLRDLS